MKKLTTLLFLITFITVYSQSFKSGENYYFENGFGKTFTNTKLKLNKTDTPPSGALFRHKSQIKILYSEGDRVFFKFLKFKSDADILAYNEDSSGEKRVFSLSKLDFENLTKPYYNKFRGFKYGAYTVPIRLRSRNDVFEFDSNLSLGANILGRIGLNRFKENSFIDLSFGISITKVNLNKENSILGKVGSDFENIDVLSPAALTVSLGILVNLAENVNIGAYLGWDRLSTADNRTQWIYNDRPWTGIGLNISFSGKAQANNSEE
tara:strand:+ start:3453 stop:4247 length:795 start_codon:yes stop_codon:yes gene_type:complete